ncbi:MAG: hypothetical protein Q8K28_14325 [Hoeflea sp.]|uniref:hypothetical protein n=1 Tax=Hoeflea sp. TaxID=1940281 RepID=UPI002730E9DC|nr:hypothetical protein [Hoeflea sp.]MDP2121070.1 hypothetical protein [Hoeflea sp.]
MYNRYLEAISIRAKIEQIMCLHNLRAESPIYWSEEGLVPKRYIDARAAHKNSSEFIEKNLRLGYQGIAENVFNTFAVLFALAAAGSAAFIIRS